MDQILSGGLVEPFRGDPKFRLGFFTIAGVDGFTDATQLCSHAASLGSIVLASFVVLTEPFLGTRCVWHFCT